MIIYLYFIIFLSIIKEYIIYNQKHLILIYYSHNIIISSKWIKKYFHLFYKTISLDMRNKIIQYIDILSLFNAQDIMISISEIEIIIDLKLIKNEWIYQFNNCIHYIMIFDVIIKYYHIKYE